MMTPVPATPIGIVLGDQIRAAHALLGRYFNGFDDTTHTRQPPHLPNHAAWSLGRFVYVKIKTDF